MKAVLVMALVAMSVVTIAPGLAQAQAVDSNVEMSYGHTCWIAEIETKQQGFSVIIYPTGPVASVTVSGQYVCI